MRRVCPECGSHDVEVLETEVVCNICDCIVDVKIDGSWAFDQKPFDVQAELKLYNIQYHRYKRAGYKIKDGTHL